MNVKALREIADYIKVHPKHFLMESWVTLPPLTRSAAEDDIDESEFVRKVIGREVDEPPCGTACCIGGWAVALHPRRAMNVAREMGDSAGYHPKVSAECGLSEDNFEIEEVAMEMLNLPNRSLFFTSDWPAKLSARYDSAPTARTRAKVGAEAIEAYIANPHDFYPNNSW